MCANLQYIAVVGESGASQPWHLVLCLLIVVFLCGWEGLAQTEFRGEERRNSENAENRIGRVFSFVIDMGDRVLGFAVQK